MSAAVTFQDFDLFSFSHSIQISDLFKTNPFKLRIISIILFLTPGRVEYS